MSKIEVIVLNEEDAKIAEANGADRLELVSAIEEGGLTPSYGTIARVARSVSIPVMVMVRPHSYHYTYHEHEWLVMQEDIRIIKELGAAGIVFGALTKDGKIDENLLGRVMKEKGELALTFHRAIDEARTLELYAELCELPFSIDQVLTSGGAHTVMEGIPNLQAMLARASSPAIMPGSGLTVDNIAAIHQELQAPFYHFGAGVRIGESFKNEIDGAAVRKVKDIVNQI